MKLTLPIYWTNEKVRAKSTTHLIGMNFFRNAHFHVKNKMKQHYHTLVENQSLNFKKVEKFTVHYKLYYKNPSCDASNIIAIIEKFTLDGLIEAEVLTDDNVSYHKSSTWEVVAQDRANPRVEIEIKELDD